MEFIPAEPKDAATIVLVRDGKVLWARRNPNIRFLGGFHAFPGGKTDAGDRTVGVANCADPELAAMLVCAVREVFEEVGVLLVRGGDRLTIGQRASLHDDLISGRSAFSEILSDWGLSIDAFDFTYTGFWTTPHFSPVRFKTRFFIAECPQKQAPYAAIGELEAVEFVTPAEALGRWRSSEVLISPPVLMHFKGLGISSEGAGLSGQAIDAAARRLLAASDSANGIIDHIELNSRAVCFPLRTKTLPPATHTNCFIVGKRKFVVIDAASRFADEQAKLAAFVGRMIANGNRCEMIIASHLHNDHIGGESALRGHLRDRFGTDVPIAAHRATAEDLSGVLEFDRLLDDHELIGLEDAVGNGFDLEVLHTPGHARGHLAFYDRGMRFLLSGDNVVGTGTVVVAPPQGDMDDYLHSLDRMRDLPGLRFLAGSHGAPVFDARRRIEQYIEHRLGRERQVLAAIGAGARTAEEIAAIVYPGLDPQLMPHAVGTVEAHLGRLANSGRIRHDYTYSDPL